MKKFKTLGYVLSLALGMTMLTGCGKKVDGVDQQSMIDKYAAYCDLPDYKGLEYEETKSTVTDADVKTKIDSLLQQYATKTQVKEGTVKEGDNVNIDFVGSIDGEEFEGGNSNGAGYDLTLGSGAMIPGFEDGIIGHKVGETFNIKAMFPENYGKDALNGKEADFKITINYITETELPEYNDAFVASYTDATTILEYEDSVRKDLVEQYDKSDKSANESAVMQVLVEKTTYNEYPEQEMQDLIDKSISQQEQAASQYGYSLGDYVTARYGFQSESDFREYVQGLAEDYMKEKIAVCAVAKDAGSTCGYEVTDNCYDAVFAEFDRICGEGKYTTVLAPQGGPLSEQGFAEKVARYLEKFKEAGHEYAREGCLSERTWNKLQRPLLGHSTFEMAINMNWDNPEVGPYGKLV